LIRLLELPGIVELEKLCRGQGQWLTQAEIAERADVVSVSLFGLTEADTYKQAITYIEAMGDDPIFDRSKHGPIVDASERAVQEWERNFAVLYDEVGEVDEDEWVEFFETIGFDVLAGNGEQLECLHHFSRQMICCARGLLPAAIFTPDGSGRRGASPSVDAETWGAALEKEARAFKPSRHR
jgi:hypothetical protein